MDLRRVDLTVYSYNIIFSRVGVGLKGRDGLGSDLIPLQYAFDNLVDD